jgi:hypothetical protein
VDDVIAEGDKTCVRLTATGHHTGNGLGSWLRVSVVRSPQFTGVTFHFELCPKNRHGLLKKTS